jgi:hypothetical protein
MARLHAVRESGEAVVMAVNREKQQREKLKNMGSGRNNRGNSISPYEIAKLKELRQQESDDRLWDRFDTLFGLFVVANGILIGVQASANSEAAFWYWIELSFWSWFVLEFFLRAVLMNQLTNYEDDSLWWGLLPRLEKEEFFRWFPDTVRNSRKFFRNHWVKFDATILVLGFLENFIFAFVMSYS